MKIQKLRVCDFSSRMDLWLKENFPEISRSLLARLIKEGRVKVNRVVEKKPSKKLQPGDLLEIYWPEENFLSPHPRFLPLDVIYEDTEIIVLSKQRGVSVHPVSPFETNTLVNALLYHGFSLSRYGLPLRPGIVHRLDKDTSGVMVIAKSDRAYLHLIQEFKARRVEKSYLVVVEGKWKEDRVIDAPLGRSRKNPLRMEVKNWGGKPSYTEITVLDAREEFSLLLVKPRTGRTHQIRAHLSFMGYPIAGDVLYGSSKGKAYFSRQALHAFTLAFSHPTFQKRMFFAASLPSDMREFVRWYFAASLCHQLS
ncbi:MAG: RluA family pseudouridine synthase [Candidatus Atribacteria bacterium]|nr:RluA family pseudouridine synthase [Candidatus Atribacteria bacterium]